MSRPSKPKSPSRPGSLTARAILRRYIKQDVFDRFKGVDWQRELALWYGKLWEQYPSLDFWQRHELSFGNESLNSMAWFLTEDGKEALRSDWLVFHYVPPAVESESQLIVADDLREMVVDKQPSNGHNVLTGTPRRARTVAEYLKS